MNAATQDTFGRVGRHVDYGALRRCFESVVSRCRREGLTLAAPKIGAGLVGGDWGTIEKIINEVAGDLVVDIYVVG